MTKPWYVLGAGSIGGLWALRMLRAELPVTLLRRPGSAHDNHRTLTLEDGQRRWQATLPQQCEPVPAPGIQRLLVCTKTQDTLVALEQWLPSLSAKACIILMQNGMGVREALLDRHPGLRLFSATTTDGVYRRTPDELVLAGRGETYIGSIDEDLRPLCRALVQELIQAGLPIWFAPDISRRLWQKLAINCAINPLAVRYHCMNGELLHKPEALAAIDAVCAELAAVMQADGFSTSTEALHRLIVDVCRQTATNTCSTLADVQAGRVTEIDWMNGYVVRRAAALGIPCPVNAALYREVRALDR
jgi:2-dehydropantoate 2-reductase